MKKYTYTSILDLRSRWFA